MENIQIPPVESTMPIDPTTAPLTSQPNQSNLLIKILFVSLLISLAGIVYLLIQVQFLKNQPAAPASLSQATPTPASEKIINNSPTPSIIVISNPTENWKSYRNQALGFEIKYPATVKIEKEMNDQYNKATIFKADKINFEIMLRETGDVTLEKYFYMDNPNFSKSTLDGEVANIYSSNVGNNLCVNDGLGPECPISYVVYVAQKGKYLYHVGFFGNSILSDSEKQILSTFKFIN